MTSKTGPLLDIGAVKRLKVLCISETGWRDVATLLADSKAAGGVNSSQHKMARPPFGDLHAETLAGSSAWIEVENLDGSVHKHFFCNKAKSNVSKSVLRSTTGMRSATRLSGNRPPTASSAWGATSAPASARFARWPKRGCR